MSAVHDSRRTVATGMQALQIRTEIIESVLNHLSGTKSGIVGVYQCYPYQEETAERARGQRGKAAFKAWRATWVPLASHLPPDDELMPRA